MSCEVFDFMLFQLRDLANLWPTVSQVEMEIIIHAFISFHPDCCNSLSKTSMDRLQFVQDAAAAAAAARPVSPESCDYVQSPP